MNSVKDVIGGSVTGGLRVEMNLGKKEAVEEPLQEVGGVSAKPLQVETGRMKLIQVMSERPNYWVLVS